MDLTPAAAERLELPKLCHASQPRKIVYLHLHRHCGIGNDEAAGTSISTSTSTYVLNWAAPVEDHADDDDGEDDEDKANHELADLLSDVGIAGLELAHKLQQPRLLNGARVLEVELLVGGRGGGGAGGQRREGYDGWTAAVVGVGGGRVAVRHVEGGGLWARGRREEGVGCRGVVSWGAFRAVESQGEQVVVHGLVVWRWRLRSFALSLLCLSLIERGALVGIFQGDAGVMPWGIGCKETVVGVCT